jgi:DNA-binding winged helix-turn-helix (wHTH) protein/tetratricopeptide (TPR) repeat protein
MPDAQAPYRFAGVVLDVAERRLHTDGRDIYLPPKTFETLLYLVERPGHLVPKGELLDAIWPGVSVTENALTRCIKEVRAALGDEASAPRCIETVPRVGYRFIAPVEAAPGPPASAAVPGTDAAEIPGAAGDRGPSPADHAPPPSAAASADRASPRWGRYAWRLLALAGLIVLVPIGSYLATPPGRAIGFGARDFLLVADLDNQCGEAVFDRSLNTAFASLLEQSRFANVFPRSTAIATLQRMGKPKDHALDEGTAREICQRENVKGLIVTSISRVGTRYAFTARLIEPGTGRVVRSRVEDADSRDGVLDALRRTAVALRVDLGESLAAIQTSDYPLQQVTTPSLEALKLFSDGVALWDRGEYKAAVKLHEDAIARDPGFAAAHAALGGAYYSFVFGDRERGQQHFERALALAERTNDRELRSIRASYAFQRGHLDEAAVLYRAYLQSYPEDFRARRSYAATLRELGRFEDASRQYEEVLRAIPNLAPTRINLATCYNPLGRYEDALWQYGRAFELEPSWITTPNINHEYGFVLVRAGQRAKARATFESALNSSGKASALRSLAMLDMYEGRYRNAVGRLREAIALSGSPASAQQEARYRLALATALAAQGRTPAARTELTLALEAARRGRASAVFCARLGVAMARLGQRSDAASLLQEVRSRVDPDSRSQVAELQRFEGEVALARGDTDDALRRFALAGSQGDNAFVAQSLALAHRLAGHRDEAARCYERVIGMVSIATGFEPQQDWLEAHYWLAALRAEAGDRAGAGKAAGTLLDLWREADTDLPLLARLRQFQAPAAR